MIIAVDFDGTCVMHEYLKVGPDVPYAVEVLQQLIKEGHLIILNTMRSHAELGIEATGTVLDDAINWFKKYKIPLYGINKNFDQISWTSSPKIYAHKYIDDAAVGCPLIINKHNRPYVDWLKIKELLEMEY